MIQQFIHHIQQFQLGDPSSRTLLAVSGGLDSMVMLELYRTAGFSIGVAHCNFQLRGKASEEDAAFVRGVCERWNIPFYTKAFATSSYADENKLSIQMAARELRYAWFDTLLDEYGYLYLATAHHLNDSIETVLLNWIHGASSEGFSGIPVQHHRIIRPMLFASRDALHAFAQEQQVAWREDKSNESDDYQRNFLRHHIIPGLKTLNPSLEQTIARGFEKNSSDQALIAAGFDQWKAKFVTEHAARMTIEKSGLVPPGGAALLWRLLRPAGFSLDVCREVLAALPGQPGKKFLSPSHQLVVDRGTLIVTPHQDFWNDTTIMEGQREAYLGSWNMTITKLGEVRKSASSFEATLDADKVTFPLLWRKWRAGDVFYPLGMEHRKKLSDFLIDIKVPVTDKECVTVLVSQGQVIWIPGYRIDNRFKITEGTRTAISFCINPYFI